MDQSLPAGTACWVTSTHPGLKAGTAVVLLDDVARVRHDEAARVRTEAGDERSVGSMALSAMLREEIPTWITALCLHQEPVILRYKHGYEPGDEVQRICSGCGHVFPERPNVVGYEAKCGKCGETFNPANEDDLEHLATVSGNECGGTGALTGLWS